MFDGRHQQGSALLQQQQQQQQAVDAGHKRRRWDEDKLPYGGGGLQRSEGSQGSQGLAVLTAQGLLTGRPASRGSRALTSPAVLELVRKALTVGFANRIARRMRLHNGYRTCNEKGSLAQVRLGIALLLQLGLALLLQCIEVAFCLQGVLEMPSMFLLHLSIQVIILRTTSKVC